MNERYPEKVLFWLKKKKSFLMGKEAGEERKRRTKEELPVPTFLRTDEASIHSRSLTSTGYL